MKTICFIPIRKGSKGIPGKNLRLLGGKPLVCRILDTVEKSGIANETWLATDSDEAERIAEQWYGGRVKVFRRSEWSARDESPTIDVVMEFVNALPEEADAHFILLQATSPFTTADELRALHREMEKQEHDSYIACCRLKKFRWSEEGKPLDYTLQSKPRRQDYKGMLVETGAFYASSLARIREHGLLISGTIRVVETGSNGLMDIDEEEDWLMAERCFGNNGACAQ